MHAKGKSSLEGGRGAINSGESCISFNLTTASTYDQAVLDSYIARNRCLIGDLSKLD